MGNFRRFYIDFSVNIILMSFPNITESWLRDQIEQGKYMANIAAELNCSKDVIKRFVVRYGLYDYYKTIPKQPPTKSVKFRFRNKELQERLAKFGPLHNVVE